MCGRYASARKRQDLLEEFRIDRDRVPADLEPDYNVAPTKPVYAVLTRSRREPGEGGEHQGPVGHGLGARNGQPGMNRAGGDRGGPAPGGRVAVLSHALHKLSLVADGAAPLGGDTCAGRAVKEASPGLARWFRGYEKARSVHPLAFFSTPG